METITITKDDFHKAVAIAVEKMTNELKEQNSSPLAGFYVPMLGFYFQKTLRLYYLKMKSRNRRDKLC